MNKYIKQQLNKVSAVDIPVFDDNTTHLIIPRLEKKVELFFQEDHFYVIKLEDYLLNPPPGFNLHTNWNHNIIPKQKYYKCQCIKVMGKMIQILGVGFDYENRIDLEETWDGWLPIKSVKIIKEI